MEELATCQIQGAFRVDRQIPNHLTVLFKFNGATGPCMVMNQGFLIFQSLPKGLLLGVGLRQ